MALTPDSFRRSPYLLGALMISTAVLTILFLVFFVG